MRRHICGVYKCDCGMREKNKKNYRQSQKQIFSEFFFLHI